MLSDFLSLLFPRVCAACENNLYKGESCICSACLYNLPETDFHLSTGNPIHKQFWGRVNIEFASSCYYFNKGEKVQKLMHALKYHNRKDIGSFLGRKYGSELLQSGVLADVDIVTAVPLHRRKLRKRGYNQSSVIAKGIADGINKPYIEDYLLKIKDSETQTRKNRHARWENIRDAFELNPRFGSRSGHILLVDDVITTGSTLEACAHKVLETQGCKLSIVSLACASL